jgi:hypothetical protein
LEEKIVANKQIDVRFRNPFYHNQFGLLGGKDDHDTVYTLPADTALPETAIVSEGESEYRKEHPPRRAHRKDGRFVADDKSTPDVNEAYEDGIGPDDPDDGIDEDPEPDRVPARKKPVEGVAKETVPVAKKRKAKAKK